MIGSSNHVRNKRNSNFVLFLYISYSVLMITPVFGYLRSDELYFLSCVYSAEVGLLGNKCYPLSIFPWILSKLVSPVNFPYGIIVFKISNYLIILLLPICISRIIQNKRLRDIKIGEAFIIMAGTFYASSVRAIEIRPEFFATVLLVSGVLIADSYARPISFNRIFSIVLLGLAMSMTPRLYPIGIILVAYISLSNTKRDMYSFGVDLGRLKLKHVISGGLILSVLTLFAFKYVYPHVQDQVNFDIIQGSWRKFSQLGLAQNFALAIARYGTLAEWYQYVLSIIRPVCFVLSLVASLIFINQSFKQNRPSFALIGVVPIAWILTLAIDKNPFGYVVMLEVAIMSVVFYIFNQKIGVRNWVMQILYTMLIVVTIGSAVSNNVHKGIPINDQLFSNPSLSNQPLEFLLSRLRSKNIIEQLRVRREICDRFDDYKFALSSSKILVCKENFKGFYFWSVTDVPIPESYFRNISKYEKVVVEVKSKFISDNSEYKRAKNFYIKE